MRATTMATTTRTPPTLASAVATAAPVAPAPPMRGTPVATPLEMPPRNSFTPTDSSMLLTAAESCIALSRAAARLSRSEYDSPRDDDDDANDAADADANEDDDEPNEDDDDRVLLVDSALLLRQHPFGGPGASGLPSHLASGLPARAPRGMKRPRSVRCGKCDGCERDDCGVCKNCVDKPKFGGIGQRKQGCVRKLCRQPRVAA